MGCKTAPEVAWALAPSREVLALEKAPPEMLETPLRRPRDPEMTLLAFIESAYSALPNAGRRRGLDDTFRERSLAPHYRERRDSGDAHPRQKCSSDHVATGE